jgi:hypothetical protein
MQSTSSSTASPILRRSSSKAAADADTALAPTLTPPRLGLRAQAAPSPLMLPRAAADPAPEGRPLQAREVRPLRDAAMEVLRTLIATLAVHQLRESLGIPRDPEQRASWTGWGMDLALGLLLRSFLDTLAQPPADRHEAPPPPPIPPLLDAAVGADPTDLLAMVDGRLMPAEGPTREKQATDGPAQLERLLAKANAHPRDPAALRLAVKRIVRLQQRHATTIGQGEAAWAIARLSQGALPLPATPTDADMRTFSTATDCLITPVKQAQRDGRISKEELEMASDHLQRQLFERLRHSPAALRGAALAKVSENLHEPPSELLGEPH